MCTSDHGLLRLLEMNGALYQVYISSPFSIATYNIHAALRTWKLFILHINYWISNSTSHAIYRASQFSKFKKHGGVFYIWECNVVNLAKNLPEKNCCINVKTAA